MLWTWRQKPKSISCWPTLYSHWTHSFPDYSLYCLQLSVFKPSTLHHWEAHVHVCLLCPHILEHPQNIHLSCLFPCLGGYCGLSVWVCLCLLSCRILNMPPLPLTYHCTFKHCAFRSLTTCHQQQLPNTNLLICHCITPPQWKEFTLSIDRVNNDTGRRVSLLC